MVVAAEARLDLRREEEEEEEEKVFWLRLRSHRCGIALCLVGTSE